jgi:signal transduction histidine kinase
VEADRAVSGPRTAPGAALAPYLRKGAEETERWVARIRVVVALVAAVAGPWMALTGRFSLVSPVPLVMAVEFLLLVYAVVYRVWEPWRRHGLRVTARVASLLDLAVVAFIIPNSGGLASHYWGVGAGIVLIYIMRFAFTAVELVLIGLVFSAVGVVAQLLAPLPAPLVSNAVIGIILSLLVVTWAGITLVRRERAVIERELESEHRTITRLINTVQHEVNNPLAIASGNIELLKYRQTDLPAPYVDRIEDALDRIGDAVRRLRELEAKREVSGEGAMERFTRMGEGEVPPDPSG